jgi:hypothetical protein
VEKVAPFCNPTSGGTFSSTAIEIIKLVYKLAVAQANVSHILRPGNTAFKEQLKLVKDSSIHALKKNRGYIIVETDNIRKDLSLVTLCRNH